MGKRQFNWDYLRQRYVSGDETITLELLSSEPNAPSIASLKRRSAEESWAEQRKRFRYQVSTNVAQSSVAQEAVEKIQRLVDAAEMLSRHLSLAKTLQGVAVKAIRDGRVNPESLQAKDVLAWIDQGVKMERLALEMDTARISVKTQVNFETLTDEQLERIASGEDVEAVVES